MWLECGLCVGLWAVSWRRGVRPDAFSVVLACVCVGGYAVGFQRTATPDDGLAETALANLCHASAGHLLGNMAVFGYLSAILNALGATTTPRGGGGGAYYYAAVFPACTAVQHWFTGGLLRAAQWWYSWSYSGLWSLLPVAWRSAAPPLARHAIGFSGIVSGYEGYAVLHVVAYVVGDLWCPERRRRALQGAGGIIDR